MNTSILNTKSFTAQEQLDLVLVAVAHNSHVRFPFVYTEETLALPVHTLNLDVRSTNAYARHKIQTIGDLLDWIENGNLERIKGLGRKSVSKTMYELCWFAYVNLAPVEQVKFLEKVVLLNCAQPEEQEV